MTYLTITRDPRLLPATRDFYPQHVTFTRDPRHANISQSRSTRDKHYCNRTPLHDCTWNEESSATTFSKTMYGKVQSRKTIL